MALPVSDQGAPGAPGSATQRSSVEPHEAPYFGTLRVPSNERVALRSQLCGRDVFRRDEFARVDWHLGRRSPRRYGAGSRSLHGGARGSTAGRRRSHVGLAA